MPEHLNEQQLRGYRDRTLAVGELLAMDSHLGGCEPCRNALVGIADKTSVESVISGIDQARFRHLSYEQMDDWVEDRLDSGGRELVMAHIGACTPCARQLISYQEYASAMAAPVQAAVVVPTQPVRVQTPKPSFWAFLKQPQYALGAAALVAMIVVSPWSRHSSPPEQTGAILAPTSTAVESTSPALPTPTVEEALSLSELDSLPDSLREGAHAVITSADTGDRPASLKGLEPGGDTTLEFPYAEVVAETQPMMRWKAFGDSYNVSLYDSRHSLISRRGNLKETRWTPPSPLMRDRIYYWEVESAGQRHHGAFRVLSESQVKELETVRAEHGKSHLVMGAVNEYFGLLTPARVEFEAMAKSGQAQAGKLVNHIDALRK